MAHPGTCWVRARVAYAILGILIGLSVGAVFGPAHYKNWNSAGWGLLSGIAAALTLYIHIARIKQLYDKDNHHRLHHWMLSGCFIQLAGVCGFVTYLVLGITQQQGLVVYGNGYYLTLVWCFMTWKWGFQLFYFSREYRNIFREENFTTLQ